MEEPGCPGLVRSQRFEGGMWEVAGPTNGSVYAPRAAQAAPRGGATCAGSGCAADRRGQRSGGGATTSGTASSHEPDAAVLQAGSALQAHAVHVPRLGQQTED